MVYRAARGQARRRRIPMLTVNDNAGGAWARKVGARLEYIGPGQNRLHVIVRRPGERKRFGFPTAWLDGPDKLREEETTGLDLCLFML
jgi:hypothetical protein